MEEPGYLKIVKYCLYRERCTSEVADKLGDTGLPPSEHGKIIDRLKKEKYLDDERYTEIYVRDKFNIKKWGRVKISHTLKQKKIPAALIQTALHQINDELYIQTIEQLAEKKNREIKKAASPFERNMKILRYLVSKGYEYDLVKDVLKNSA